jgi:hypothetical protein
MSSDLSNYFEDAILNVMRGSSLSSFTAYAALFLLGSGVTFTVNSTSNIIQRTAHGKSNGDLIVLDSTVTLPGGLSKATKYYVVNANTDDFQVATSYGGSAIDLTDTGSGTHSYYDFAPTTVNDKRQIASSAGVSWIPSGADYGVIGALAIYDAPSSGNLICTMPLTPRTLQDNDTYSIATGALTIAMN